MVDGRPESLEQSPLITVDAPFRHAADAALARAEAVRERSGAFGWFALDNAGSILDTASKIPEALGGGGGGVEIDAETFQRIVDWARANEPYWRARLGRGRDGYS